MAKIENAISKFKDKSEFYNLPEWKWSDKDISDYRDHTGLFIPEDFKYVIKNYGCIGWEITELYFRAKFPDGTWAIGEIQIMFSSFERCLKDYDLLVRDPVNVGRLPSFYVVFGTADGGRSSLLADGRNSESSAVYYWPLAFDPLGEGDNVRGVAKAADTLAEFIEGLRPRDEL